ncbi:hypothetical protein ACU8KH_04898 [Lachancea thermotolerans]
MAKKGTRRWGKSVSRIQGRERKTYIKRRVQRLGKSVAGFHLDPVKALSGFIGILGNKVSRTTSFSKKSLY